MSPYRRRNDLKQLAYQSIVPEKIGKKDVRPGIWICMCGGKSATGESAEQTAMREINEELGLGITESYLTLYKKVNQKSANSLSIPIGYFGTVMFQE